MATSRFARTYIDYSREKSTVDFRIREMTAATIAAVLTEAAALGTAIDDLTGGNLLKSQLLQDSAVFSPTPPTDANMQRERKWLVLYSDTVNGKKGQVELPISLVVGASTDPLLLLNTDQADLTATEWVAFIAAFETTARSVDGNVVNIDSAYLVGRNL